MNNHSQSETFFTYFATYCGNKHGDRYRQRFSFKSVGFDLTVYLCGECRELAAATYNNRINCSKEPKPPCRKCEDNCHGDNREKVRKVMMYSGLKRLLKKV